MFCNLFDTVRTTTHDFAQAEGLFFHMILSGYHPTLSMNQAVDSTAINILSGTHKEFLDLVDRNLIRFSLFRSFKSTAEYLDTHLVPVENKECNPFIFSSLPFLYTDAYPLKDRQRIYDAMRKVLHGEAAAVPGRITVPNTDHADMLTAYALGARALADRIEGKYLDPAPVESELLGQRFATYVDQIRANRPDIELSPVILELRRHIDVFREENDLDPRGTDDRKHWQLDNRSYFYGRIDEITGGDKKLAAEPKAVIDLFYNERTASNISDGEDDLMIIDSAYKCLRPYTENDTKEAQTHTVSPVDAASPYATRFVTWEALKVVCDMVDKDCRRPEERRKALAECCEKAGLPKFDPGCGMAEQEFCFSATVLMALDEAAGHSGPKKRPSRNWWMDTTRCRIDRSERTGGRTNTAALKSDFAGEET